MKQYGCIGKKLTYSFFKEIHAMLADYNYALIELAEEEIAEFFRKKNFAAINVTDPYKQAVIPYLDSISDIAKRKCRRKDRQSLGLTPLRIVLHGCR